MNQPNPLSSFFSILFGGLIIFMIGIGVFVLGTSILHTVGRSHTVDGFASSTSDTYTFDPNAAYAYASAAFHYSAADEEDVINAAAQSLPHSEVKGITADAYSVKDITTGAVIAEKNSFQLLPIASLTKLVTAIVARKFIPDSAHVVITKKVMQTYGNTASFKAGETFSAGDLMYPMLMVSSNDAAEAYAQYYGRTQFIQTMNDFAQSIGAYRTYFADPSGLDPRNVSTANDLALILNWIRINDPFILATTELKTKTIRTHTWVNPTHFLSWSYYIGGKNGYLPESDRTNASLFKWGANGDVYAVIVLGSSQRDADTIALLKKIGN